MLVTPEQISTHSGKLAFPDITSLYSLAFIEGTKTPNSRLMSLLNEEYAAIYYLLTHTLDHERLLTAKTSLILAKRTEKGDVYSEMSAPEEAGFNSIRIPFLTHHGSAWMRDSFTVLNGTTYITQRNWTFYDEKVVPSPLGEGGSVISLGKSVVIPEHLWDLCKKEEAVKLREAGFKFAIVPSVDRGKQKFDFEFERDHIDGHLSLVGDCSGRQYLLAAKSYALQGGSTRKAIRRAAESIGAEEIIIDDRNLPPLSFNFLFTDSGQVLMTKEADELENVLNEVIGKDCVFTTPRTLEAIPLVAFGSIRCLTNYLPSLPDYYWEVEPKPFNRAEITW